MRRIIAVVVGLCVLLTGVYAQEVDILKCLGVLNGDCNGELNLDTEVSRAEFIKMVVMSSQYAGETNGNTYNDDLTNGHWASRYIKVAHKNGIIRGYEDEILKSDENISLKESLAIVLRVLGLNDYTDLQLSEQKINQAAELGLMNGLKGSVDDDYTLKSDAVRLVANMLFCKNSDGEYQIEFLGYDLIENVKILALDKYSYVFTTTGIFKSTYEMPSELIGKEGYLILDNNREIKLFIINESDDNEMPGEDKVEETYQGPYTAVSKRWLNSFAQNISFERVIRNGQTIDINDVEAYDVLYLANNSKDLLVYDNKFTGVYQSASPNSDSPEEITVSGNSYKIDSVVAFSKLYSGGQYKLGNAVTLLLGKDGGVVDVVDSSKVKNVGYITDVGAKNFTIGKATTKNYYITVQFPDGKKADYMTKSLHKNYKNQIVSVTFENKYANITIPQGVYKPDGIFDMNKGTFGKEILSKNIQILDVYSTNPNAMSLHTKVTPKRIDMADISSHDVLYCEKDHNGKITKLVLQNVTGDMLKYGMCVKADKDYAKYKGTFSYDIGGSVYSVSTSNKIYGVEKGIPAVFVASSDNKTIETMRPLINIKGYAESVTSADVKVDNKVYPLSGNVSVYVRNYSGAYLTMTLEDLVLNKEKYNICAYCDKMPQYGGTVRVLLVSKK